MIDLHNVTKYYRAGSNYKFIIDAVSGTIPRRNIAILGANGSGKSTLLRMLAGVELPNSGRIVRNVKVSFPLGFSGSFNGQLTGAENALFVARIYGQDSEYLLDFVEEFADLGPYFRMPFKDYSSGMRARLAFGVSLAINFELYLVDEITEVGDQRFRARSNQAFREKLKNANIIMVSHAMASLREYCEMGMVLSGGNISVFEDIEDAIRFHQDMMKLK